MTSTMLPFHIILVGTLAAHCFCEDAPACNANDSGDDTCQFLQGPVGVAVIGRGADVHATATKRNDVQAESVPPIALNELVKEEHVLVSKKSEVQAKSGEHDEGWPGDLLKKFKEFFHAGMNLEKEFFALDKEWARFEKFVASSMEFLVTTNGKMMSLAQEQKKVMTALMKIHADADKIVKSIAKARVTYTKGIGKVLPHQVSSVFESIFRHAERDAQKFSQAFADAARKIGAANTTAICAKCEGALGGIEKTGMRFVESALGMTIKDFEKETRDLLAKLPKEAQKEVDKFLKRASAAGQRMEDSLPKVVKEVKEGVAKVFKAQCPDLGKKSGAERSVSFSALLLGIVMWLA